MVMGKAERLSSAIDVDYVQAVFAWVLIKHDADEVIVYASAVVSQIVVGSNAPNLVC